MAFKKSIQAYFLVNLITASRLLFACALVMLALRHEYNAFKWILAISFSTDAIDGFLARRWDVCSELGSKLDSYGDDATIVAAALGIYVFVPGFFVLQQYMIGALVSAFVLQSALSLIKYRKMSSFHTYTAKGAAVLQAAFLITLFFTGGPVMWLFYTMAILTILQLLEETLMVLIIPKWRTNVKGLWWLYKDEPDL